MGSVIDIGNQKQLFIDDKWFASQRGMTLTANPPVKAERVFVPEKPWESSRISLSPTILEDGGIYKMWYRCSAPGSKETAPHGWSMICYAVSEDGIHWERQNVNLFEWEGIAENNILMPGAHGGVTIDPNGPDEHRYKALIRVVENDVWPGSKGAVFTRREGWGWSELYLATSPDGIHWTRQEPSALPFFHDTHNHLFFDARLGKYVAYVRTHARKRTVGRVEFDDPMDLPWPYRDNPDAPRGPGRTRREAGGEIAIALTCDESDPPDTDLYTPFVHPYPWAADAYFAFPSPYRHYPVGEVSLKPGDPLDPTLKGPLGDERGVYSNSGPVEVHMAVSRDGIVFSRPDRRPYVPLGLVGSWDGGQTYMGLGMIRKGDEIWQYYLASEHVHGLFDRNSADRAGGICRLVQRLDGFISADADYTGAEFTTPLLEFSGTHLQLNADCSAMGEIWVEIRDDRNVPVPGYTMEDSVSVERNQTAAPVVWREREDVAELVGRPVRLHFRLRACKLYAFQFSG